MTRLTEMRPSRVLRKMRAGKTAICTKLNLTDPRAAEIAARSGFDCIWLDMEHVPNSIEAVENQIRAAKMHDVDALVRVRRGSYSDMILPLEMDAAGIMVPHLMSAKEAREVVYYTKFHPVGRRPWDGGNADGGYTKVSPQKYIKEANEQRFVIVQIEDPEPLDELEEIAATEGIDMLLFGPGDFSQGIGHPGDFSNPKVAEVRALIPKICKKHGKFAGTVGGVTMVPELVELGYDFLSIGADVVALCDYFTAITKELGLDADSDETSDSVYKAD